MAGPVQVTTYWQTIAGFLRSQKLLMDCVRIAHVLLDTIWIVVHHQAIAVRPHAANIYRAISLYIHIYGNETFLQSTSTFLVAGRRHVVHLQIRLSMSPACLAPER